MIIDKPNQVWCADITYIPLAKGFLYLVAIMDRWSRKVLAWRLSNTMDVRFCVDALNEALERHGRPTIFNTDPRQPVYLLCVDATAARRRYPHLDERAGTFPGQPSSDLRHATGMTVPRQSSSASGGR
jgi:putative transposase